MVCGLQVAERQGKYLAKSLNAMAKQGAGHAGAVSVDLDIGKPFVYKHAGSMATVGQYKALIDLRENQVNWQLFCDSCVVDHLLLTNRFKIHCGVSMTRKIGFICDYEEEPMQEFFTCVGQLPCPSYEAAV